VGWGEAVRTIMWNLLSVTKNLGYDNFLLFLIINKNANHDFRETGVSKSVD
jgi:hypothetical protein